MTEQDKKDFIIEHEGKYIYDAGLSEPLAIRRALEDLTAYIERGEDEKNP